MKKNYCENCGKKLGMAGVCFSCELKKGRKLLKESAQNTINSITDNIQKSVENLEEKIEQFKVESVADGNEGSPERQLGRDKECPSSNQAAKRAVSTKKEKASCSIELIEATTKDEEKLSWWSKRKKQKEEKTKKEKNVLIFLALCYAALMVFIVTPLGGLLLLPFLSLFVPSEKWQTTVQKIIPGKIKGKKTSVVLFASAALMMFVLGIGGKAANEDNISSPASDALDIIQSRLIQTHDYNEIDLVKVVVDGMEISVPSVWKTETVGNILYICGRSDNRQISVKKLNIQNGNMVISTELGKSAFQDDIIKSNVKRLFDLQTETEITYSTYNENKNQYTIEIKSKDLENPSMKKVYFFSVGNDFYQITDSIEVGTAYDYSLDIQRIIDSAVKVDSSFTIRYLDVGQGDATLLECDGHYMLIDGGNNKSSDIIYTVLKNNNVESVDMVFASHADEDHVGGLAGAYKASGVKHTFCPVSTSDTHAFADFKKAVEEDGHQIEVPQVGKTYSLGSAVINILGVNAGKDNNSSIVLKVTYGNTEFLFTGDAEKDAEQKLLDAGADLKANMIKIAHHGSKDSTSEIFLKTVDPQFAIISAGKDNLYYHPTQVVLDELKENNIAVYRTDLQGDIVCKSDGKKISIATEKKAASDLYKAPEEKKEETAPNKESGNSTPTSKPSSSSKPSGSSGTSSSTKPSGSSGSGGSKQTYILNVSTKKFHYPSCGSAGKIKPANKSTFTGTREELISRGFSPCGNCHP